MENQQPPIIAEQTEELTQQELSELLQVRRLGFSPKVLTSSTRPGQAFTEDVLTDDEYRQMAAASEFAGENLFLNYTCANAPLSAAPHAGEITYTKEKLKHIVEIFHAEGKTIGAHIEGDESALLFMECGGDVIHHGHAISPAVGKVMAEKHISLVVTPLAGTSKRQCKVGINAGSARGRACGGRLHI